MFLCLSRLCWDHWSPSNTNHSDCCNDFKLRLQSVPWSQIFLLHLVDSKSSENFLSHEEFPKVLAKCTHVSLVATGASLSKISYGGIAEDGKITEWAIFRVHIGVARWLAAQGLVLRLKWAKTMNLLTEPTYPFSHHHSGKQYWIDIPVRRKLCLLEINSNRNTHPPRLRHQIKYE